MPTLNWIGKQAVETHHKDVPFRLLEAVPELSAGDTDSGNVIVQGDNLLALKALLPRYAGQVKCIYIDPPYNTGNEGWVYNDNVNSPEIQRWLGDVVGKEGETLDRHDRWLCMMYPRLMLLKQFLRDDGSIWISMDESEIGHLRCLMDEIFGRQNFITCIAWQKRYSRENRVAIGEAHEYILVYSSNPIKFKAVANKLPLGEKQLAVYKNPNNDSRGQWRSVSLSAQGYRPNQMYEIISPLTGKKHVPPEGSCWKVIESEYKKLLADNRIYFGKDGNAIPQRIQFLSSIDGIAPWTWWPHEEAGHTDESRKEIQDIFHTQTAFDTPKPTRLIQRILQIATNKDDLILDSFAGSGTTAHAVLKQNAEDGGNRRFILVEMDATIAQTVTAERMKRVSQGYTNAKGHAVAGLGSGFQFYKLSDEPLFTAEGVIRADVSFTQLAEFVWFMETGTGLALPVDTVLTSPLLGIHNNQAVFLLYNGILKDKTDAGGNVLNLKTLSLLREYLPEATMPSVVYGAFTRFDKTKLQQLNINFHQLPYELAVKTWF